MGGDIEIEIEGAIWRADHAAKVGTVDESIYTPSVQPPPTNDVAPQVSGGTVVAAVLTAAPGEWHGGDGPLEYRYQWQRCDGGGAGCSDIAGSTNEEYRIDVGDLGATLRVRVTAATGPAAGIATSDPTAPIDEATAPTNLEAPAITGTPAEREQLVATTGAWAGSEPLEYEYQWQACDEAAIYCEDIVGADADRLVLGAGEVSSRLRVVVTVGNAAGEATAISDPGAPVEAAPPPVNTEPPAVTALGAPAPGSFLSTDGGTWENAADSDLGYLWERCDAAGAGCDAILDADERVYDLVGADIGARLRVEVTAITASGEASAMSAMSNVVATSAATVTETFVLLNEERDTIFLSRDDGSHFREVADCASLPQPQVAGPEDCELRLPRISPDGRMIAVQNHVTGGSGAQDRVGRNERGWFRHPRRGCGRRASLDGISR